MARTWRVAAVIVIMGLASASVDAAGKWKRVDSRTVSVVGNVPPSTLKNIAVHLEQFRDILAQLLPGAGAPAPMVVIAFPDERAYRPFMPLFGGKPVAVGGFFVRNDDTDYLTLNTENGEQVYRIVFHEYAHSMVSNVIPAAPVWLGEGLAEYHSTFEASSSGERAQVGRAIVEHIGLLQTTSLLPVEQLMAVGHDSPLYNESNRRTVFYAQSWALVHYLAIGNDARSGQLSRFVTLLAGGTPQPDAFREAFQCEPAELGRELSRYVTQRSFSYREYGFKNPIGVDRASDPTPISEAEAEAYLADMLWRSGREADARTRLASAMQAEPGNARAFAVLGTLETSRQQFDPAVEHLERAALLSPSDATFQYGLGAALVRQVLQSGVVDPSDPRLQKSKAALSRAVSLRPGYPHAMALLALAKILTDDDLDQAVEMVKAARRTMPARDDWAHIEAQGLAKRGQFADARNVLGRAMARSTSDAARADLRNQLAHVTSLERQAEVARTAPAREDAPRAVAPEAPASGAPARPSMVPVLRPVKAGEQRVFGTFEAVECDGGTVVLRLTVQGEVWRFLITNWGDADFISYRDDVSRSIICGPQAPPRPVLVTWRPVRSDTPAGSRLAGELAALELVPDGYVPR